MAMSTTTTIDVDIGEITARLRAGQRQWAMRTVRERLRCVRALRRLLCTEEEALCAAVEQDIRKPAIETVPCELLPLAEACRFLERHAVRLLRPRRLPLRQLPLWLFHQSDAVHHRPRGVVGIIGTWNYPLFLNGVQILHALAAGNTVLWKPSEVAPASADALTRLLRDAGIGEDLLHVLPASREMGRRLTDADVDHVVFTGHADTGRKIAESLGRRLISSTLELSGCDAMFVLEDADTSMAACAAWFGATLNRGQTCLAVRRVFVARSLYSRFIEALRPLVAQSSPIRPVLPGQGVQGEELIREAVNDGASLIRSPMHDPGFAPTVLFDVKPDMAACREASFVPLLAVLPFDNIEEALEADAVCPYALGASIFTVNRRQAHLLAARLRAGAITINDVVAPTGHPGTPFGGRAASGWGVTQGAEGLLEMTVPQVVSVRSGSWRPHYDPPGQSRLTTLAAFRAMLRLGHAGSIWDRFRGFGRLLRAVWRGPAA
jgi:acyl-CoA reductase-like NAD-dependent aldehyde dehydrogenase